MPDLVCRCTLLVDMRMYVLHSCVLLFSFPCIDGAGRKRRGGGHLAAVVTVEVVGVTVKTTVTVRTAVTVKKAVTVMTAVTDDLLTLREIL